MRKGGIAAVYLFAQFLRDQVAGQRNDGDKVNELNRVLNLLLDEHLLVVEVADDREIQVPS
jgi:hypothetical protein